MSDEKLENLVEEYAELAKDKKIDAATLMMNALQNQETNRISPKTKRWAYLVSLGLPPFGLLFAAWFLFSDKDDRNSTAIICIILTVASLALTILLFQSILSGSGTSVEQIQQIKPKDIMELTQ